MDNFVFKNLIRYELIELGHATCSDTSSGYTRVPWRCVASSSGMKMRTRQHGHLYGQHL